MSYPEKNFGVSVAALIVKINDCLPDYCSITQDQPAFVVPFRLAQNFQ